MHRNLARRALLLPALLSAACAMSRPIPDYGRPLPEGAPALIKLGLDERKPDLQQTWRSRAELLPALDRSIQWTRLEYAQKFFPMAGITHALALTSLERFRELLVTTTSASEFDSRVKQDFDYYKSAGWDGKGGGVLFTGYFTPILAVARTEGAYRPALRAPEDSRRAGRSGQRTAGGLQPHPTR
jgi:membrane-bound lytic murein transglycosylase A